MSRLAFALAVLGSVPLTLSAGNFSLRSISQAWINPILKTLEAAPPEWFQASEVPLFSRYRSPGLQINDDFKTYELRPLIRALENRYRHAPETFRVLLSQEERRKLLVEAAMEARRQIREAAAELSRRHAAGELAKTDYPDLLEFWKEAAHYLDDQEANQFNLDVVLPLSRVSLDLAPLGQETAARAARIAGALSDRMNAGETAFAAATDETKALAERYDPERAKKDDSLFKEVQREFGPAIEKAAEEGDREAPKFLSAVNAAFSALKRKMEASQDLREIREGHAGPWARAALEGYRSQVEKLSHYAAEQWLRHLIGGLEMKSRIEARPKDLLAWLSLEHKQLKEKEDAALERYYDSLRAFSDPAMAGERGLAGHFDRAMNYYWLRLKKAQDPWALREVRDEIVKGTRDVPPLKKLHALWAKTAGDRSETRTEGLGSAMARLKSGYVAGLAAVLGLLGASLSALAPGLPWLILSGLGLASAGALVVLDRFWLRARRFKDHGLERMVSLIRELERNSTSFRMGSKTGDGS